ncbi:nicotinate-nucleotide--dimethylbenzimidazole phosphoribosyltransferase [Nakamurella antarctica]|uniref:Nicotinate-nucleotide--dimethylbenzimidazole phosphoribosyltransferase n=1 Tax=Nakamurella antarctica TaxID=1902245 RepID=A0A3G8ZNV3_9ACTN|nr:nicotinate-nucleotide--dimethylbenzimidazole phosphoribosyltransferase [Nakamurella antarctica]AZI58465.1 nicotinate-nucleotide--dimethylbenzimidazole phosphoribosyltransferase [Nakamurella antarctica]
MSEESHVEFGEVLAVDPAHVAGARESRIARGYDADTIGHLGPVLDWLAACQGQPEMAPLARPRVVAFSSEGTETTLPASLICAVTVNTGVGVRVVGSPVPMVKGGIGVADALTEQSCNEALHRGKHAADSEIDSGADLLMPVLSGAEPSVALNVLVCALTGMEPVEAIGLSEDLDISLWVEQVGEIRDALRRSQQSDAGVLNVRGLLRMVGGAELAALTGFITQAAIRRTPVIVDGLAGFVAAVLAHRLAPGAQEWMMAATPSRSRAGRRLAEMLGLKAVVDLGTDSSAGAGALLALPMILAAVNAVTDAS